MNQHRGMMKKEDEGNYEDFLTPEEIKAIQLETKRLIRLLEELDRAEEGSQGKLDEPASSIEDKRPTPPIVPFYT